VSIEEIALPNPRTNKMYVHIGLVLWPFVALMSLANLHHPFIYTLFSSLTPLAGCVPLHELLISGGNIVFNILIYASLIYGHFFSGTQVWYKARP